MIDKKVRVTRRITSKGNKLWQKAVRALFKHLQRKTGLNEVDAWTLLRVEITKTHPDRTEEELEMTRAVLFEEKELSIQVAAYLDGRFKHTTPLVDAFIALLSDENQTK